MTIELSTPTTSQLGAVVDALRDWQRESAPIQLHPGDLGWHWQFGPELTATALRTWRRDGQLIAIGLLDGPTVLRLTVAPDVWHEHELADQLVADLAEPGRGVLPAGQAAIETPDGSQIRAVLAAAGWQPGEPWTPLRHDLAGPLEQALRIEAIGPDQLAEFIAVHQSAWDSKRFTDELWHSMAAGLPYADARCLLGYDDRNVPVAGVTVWSAGPGRPGLLEPMGVHADHRGHGHGKAICLAAAAELGRLGSSSALVCTPNANTGAVASYRSAGFRPLPERLDLVRDA